MENTAEKIGRPVKVMVTPGQISEEAHKEIQSPLRELGYSNPETVPSAEQKPPYKEGVEGMGGEAVGEFLDVAGSLGTAAVEKVTGKEMHSDTRNTPSGKFHWLTEIYRRIKSKDRGE